MKGKWSWRWFYIWTLIYVINLPLPLFLGFSRSADFGRVGIVVAIFLLWFFGVALHLVSRQFRFALCLGASFVAFTQFVPIIHFYCGLAAMVGMKVATGLDYSSMMIDSIFPGFAITVVTGQLLAATSVIIGYAFIIMFELHNPFFFEFLEPSLPKQADLKEENGQSPMLTKS